MKILLVIFLVILPSPIPGKTTTTGNSMLSGPEVRALCIAYHYNFEEYPLGPKISLTNYGVEVRNDSNNFYVDFLYSIKSSAGFRHGGTEVIIQRTTYAVMKRSVLI